MLILILFFPVHQWNILPVGLLDDPLGSTGRGLELCSQAVVCRAAWALLGKMLKMPTLKPHLRPTESQSAFQQEFWEILYAQERFQNTS